MLNPRIIHTVSSPLFSPQAPSVAICWHLDLGQTANGVGDSFHLDFSILLLLLLTLFECYAFNKLHKNVYVLSAREDDVDLRDADAGSLFMISAMRA